jgi:RNA polymerase sporulation-specific sigma factor
MTYLEVASPVTTRIGLNEEEAVLRAKMGDSRAAEWLFARYRSMIERRASMYYMAGADHEDVVQEGMMGLWKAIRDFRGDRLTRFGSFAELCITRQMLTAVKSAIRHKHSPLNDSVSLHQRFGSGEVEVSLIDVIANIAGVNPEELLLARANGKKLPDGLEDILSPHELGVVNMYVLGRPYRDIAWELECSCKSVDNALQRAKKKLRRVISEV